MNNCFPCLDIDKSLVKFVVQKSGRTCERSGDGDEWKSSCALQQDCLKKKKGIHKLKLQM